MGAFDAKNHWEKVYQSKKPTEVSWYQLDPTVSLELIALTKIGAQQKIIDIGGGASVLADKLLQKGFKNIAVLDISAKAIQHAKERLSRQAKDVFWIEADITTFKPPHQYDLWHDRAVFHFLADPLDRKKYVEAMKNAVGPGGYVIMATFALDGSPKCSGLPVERYSPETLKNEIGNQFELMKSVEEAHTTPFQTKQKFVYCCFKKH